jgi:hypothetical protein
MKTAILLQLCYFVYFHELKEKKKKRKERKKERRKEKRRECLEKT